MDQGSGVGRPRNASFSPTEGGSVVGLLPAGIVFWGGLGKLLDNWLGTQYLTALGLAVGSVLAMYLVYVHVVRRPALASESESSADLDRSEEESTR